MHIHNLPPEMLLEILFYLPVESLCALESVSRHFRALITENVNKIYKPIAITHQFASQGAVQRGLKAALRDALKTLGPTKSLQDMDDWKQFCKKCFLLEKSWTPARGEGQPQYRRMGTLRFSGQHVDGELFVDETERTVALHTSRRRVELLSMDTGERLWKLDASLRLLGARDGFLIFKREGASVVDVWRRSTDCYHPDSYLPSCPTSAQIVGSPEATAAFPFGHLPLDGPSNAPTMPPPINSVPRAAPGLPRRGVYLPFAQIAYRAGYDQSCYTHPHLAVLRRSFPREGLSTVDIWHLPTLQRLARLCVDRDIGTVEDIAVGPTHLYVATLQRIVAYKWLSATSDQSGQPVFLPAYPQFVMQSPAVDTNTLPMFICERRNQGTTPTKENDTGLRLQNLTVLDPLPLPTDLRKMDVKPELEEPSPALDNDTELGPTRRIRAPRAPRVLQPVIPAFHMLIVSPDGKDLLAIAGDSWMVYLPSFPSRGSAATSQTSMDSQGAFALAIGDKPSTIPETTMLSWLTVIRDLVFDGNRVLLSDDEDVFSFVVKDRRHLEPTQNLETTAGSLRIRPNFTVCEFKQLKLAWPEIPSYMQLSNERAWFPNHISARERLITYVDFADFEATKTKVEASQR